MEDIYDIDFSDLNNKLFPHFMRSMDYVIKNGDIYVTNTTEQESYFILESDKGHVYQSPLLGVGIKKHLNADLNKNDIRKAVRTELERDGVTVRNIYVINTEDVTRLNITDPEILSQINENGYVIALDIVR